MKKIIKIFSFLFFGVVILLLLLTITAKLTEDKIADMATQEVGNIIEAPVAINHVSFNLLRKFPYATIELNNVFLGTPEVPSQKINNCSSDTIISLGKVFLIVKTKPLIDAIIEIVKVEVKDACLEYSVNKKGESNIDFLLAKIGATKKDTTSSQQLAATLKELNLKNIHCFYSDSTLDIKARLFIPNVKVSGAVKGDSIAANVFGNMELFDARYPKVPLHLMERTKINLDASYVNDSVNVRNLELDIDGAKIKTLGHILIGKNIFTDLKLNATDFDLAKLIKYAPAKIKKQIGLNKVGGVLTLGAQVKGKYISKDTIPQVNVKVNLANGYVSTAKYPELKKLHFSGKATNGVLRNNKSTSAVFNDFYFETENSKFDFDISLKDFTCFRYKVKSKCDININDFKSFIPDTIVDSISGNINLNLITNGILPDSITNEFIDNVMANSKLNLGIKNLSLKKDSVPEIKDLNTQITYNPNHIIVENLSVSMPDYQTNIKNTLFDINYSGSVNNYKKIEIDSAFYSIETDSTKVSGNAQVSSLAQPSFNIFTDMSINLNEFAHFVPDTVLAKISGKVDAKMYANGKIDTSSISDQITNILFNSSSLNIKLKNVEAQLPKSSPYGASNINGMVRLNKSQLHINKLSLDALGVNIAIDSTRIDKIYESIIKKIKNEQVVMQTNISLGTVNYNSLAEIIKSDTTSSENKNAGNNKEPYNETETQLLLPNFAKLGIPHFLARGNIKVNKIIYEQNIVDDVSLKFRFSDSLYVVDKFKLKTCDGDLETSLKLEARGQYWDEPMVDLKNTITNLNVEQFLFRNEKYIKSQGITSENLSGILSSELHVRIFYKDLVVNKNTERIRAKGDLKLEQGKLYNFEPLKEASVSIGGLKEIDNLDFNTLTTSFFMFKNKIYIPKTDVVTNALDLTAFGMHGLSDTIGYEYHFGIHLGHILAGKSKKLIEKQKDKGENSVNKNSMDLISMKTPESKRNSFDTENLKSSFVKRLKRQEAFLNLLFDPRLVNFNTDLDRSNFVKSQSEE